MVLLDRKGQRADTIVPGQAGMCQDELGCVTELHSQQKSLPLTADTGRGLAL